MSDWIPGLPTSASSPMMKWPSYMIQSVQVGNDEVLVLREEAGRTERQWKGMLSWMLGIAGTRHILSRERYRWIAPLSAFYPEVVQSVSQLAWPATYPPGSIVANRAPGYGSHLRPDYLALRQTDSTDDWAVVEAKGTKVSLENRLNCPTDWYNQARNVILTINGNQITPSRNVVVATRVNPNAVNELTRQIQIRAWNSTDDSSDTAFPPEASVDIAAAHMYGFFRNLRLLDVAHAIALSTETRFEVRRSADQRQSSNQERLSRLSEALDNAEIELQQHTRFDDQPEVSQSSTVVSFDAVPGLISFELAEPLLELARSLVRSSNYDAAYEAMVEADSGLNGWEHQVRLEDSDDVILPFGVRVRIPSEFGQAL